MQKRYPLEKFRIANIFYNTNYLQISYLQGSNNTQISNDVSR